MTRRVLPEDPGFFTVLAAAGSLSAAARELGLSTAAVSKHLARMEQRLGVPLVVRTTRRMSLTPEGNIYLEHARRIVAETDELEQSLAAAGRSPRGLLRVNATLGFGRSHVAPLVARFVRRHPQIEVQLQLSVNPPALTDDAWDVCIRFGPPPDAQVMARRLAANRRLLCASPDYLARRGTPRTPDDLRSHDCITIRQGDEAYGLWRLAPRQRHGPPQAVKVRGALSTNDGGIAVQWALDGHGILMRAEWDVQRHLASGQLVPVLADHETPDADIHAVWPRAQNRSQRVRAFVDHLAQAFSQQSPAPEWAAVDGPLRCLGG